MLRRTVAGVAVALALVTPAVSAQEAHASHGDQEFSGDWLIGFESQRGHTEWDLHLAIEGGEIVGDATHDELSGYRFKVEGRQTGEEVNFILYIDIPDHEAELYFSGTLSGDEAEGKLLINGETFLWSGERTG